MRNKIILVFVILPVLLLSFSIYAQRDYIQGRTEKVFNYLNLLKSYQNEFDEKVMRSFQLKPGTKDTNEKALKEMTKMMFEAIEENPVVFEKKCREDYLKLSEELKDDLRFYNKNRKTEPMGMIHGTFLRIIQHRFPTYVYNLVRIPIFLKAKVISITKYSDTLEITEKTKMPSARMILELEPEIVVKGKDTSLNGNEFKVYFRYWEPIDPNKDFVVGKSYLIPIEYRNFEYNVPYAVAAWIDENGGRFLVENNILYDEKNTFGLGKKVKWEEFIKDINIKVNKIKNMLEY